MRLLLFLGGRNRRSAGNAVLFVLIFRSNLHSTFAEGDGSLGCHSHHNRGSLTTCFLLLFQKSVLFTLGTKEQRTGQGVTAAGRKASRSTGVYRYGYKAR